MQELNAIQQAFNNLVFYHAFFAAFFALPFVINLYALYTYKNFVSLNKKIWFVMPLIFFLLAVAFLSGLNVSITSEIYLSLPTIMMWLYWFFVFGGEIIRLQKLKVAIRTDKEAMLGYVRFCKRLYTLNLLGFTLVYFWS